MALESHGFGLPLEKTAGGANNFSFGESGQPPILPAIGRLLLPDAAIASAGNRHGRQVRCLQLVQVYPIGLG